MIRKKTLLRKRLCVGMLASVILVGVSGCSSPPPSSAQPTQPPTTYPVTQPFVQTPTVPQNPTPQKTWEIRGRKFLDQDGNRQYSSQDKGVAGWDIRLYPASAIQANTWNSPMASITTDANGAFSFKGLASGNYLVVTAPQGNNGEKYQQVTPTDTAYAKSVTLPQQSTGYCQPQAYQVTVDNNCPQTCDLAFVDQGMYGGYPGYGGYGDPYGGYPGYGYPGYPGYPGLGYPPVIGVPIYPGCDEEEEEILVAPVALRSASNFAILAGTAIFNTGNTIVTGDIGVSPGTTVTGFPPGIVNGCIAVNDTVAMQAKNDLTTAINDAFSRSCANTVKNGCLAGKNLLPGVYKAEGGTFNLAANGILTLDANGCGSDAVWIFQAQEDLVANTLSKVVYANGAKPSNIFWVIGGSATLGTSSSFVGSILARQSITFNNAATLQGRALALGGEVTLDTNIVNRPQSQCK